MTAKKSANEKLIEQAIAKAKEELSGTSVQYCTFNGVQFDAKAVEAINLIAQGLGKNAESQMETAKGFQALAQVLKASNVEIESMLKLVGK